MRVITAFVRFCAPSACLIPRVPGANVPVHTSRLRRFDALDGFNARNLCPDFSRHPLVGFTLRSFSLSPGPYWLSLSSREPHCRRTVTPARSQYPRAIPWHAAVESLRPRHSSFGFRVLLPLRVRPPCVAVTPFTARCFPGVCLSGDFSLHAPDPPSRVFRSRTCTDSLATVTALSLSGFSCVKISLPLQRSRLLRNLYNRAAVPSEVFAFARPE